MLRAVIFDFDGVITDTEALHLRAFNQVLARYNIEITTERYYENYLGMTDRECFEAIDIDAEQIEGLISRKNNIFEQLLQTPDLIIESVPRFLQTLSDSDIPMAICSGALLHEIELILQQASLRSYFEVIVAADHVKKGKPSPEGFLLALQQLNSTRKPPILPAECIVIEDSHWGLEAAIAAKMHTIAVTNSYAADQLQMSEKIVVQLGQLTINQLHLMCS